MRLNAWYRKERRVIKLPTYPDKDNAQMSEEDAGGTTKKGWAFPGCKVSETLEACKSRLEREAEGNYSGVDTPKKKEDTTESTGGGSSGSSGSSGKKGAGILFTFPGCLPGESAKECRDRMTREQIDRKQKGKSTWDITD